MISNKGAPVGNGMRLIRGKHSIHTLARQAMILPARVGERKFAYELRTSRSGFIGGKAAGDVY